MFNIARFSEQFKILFRQNKTRHGMILSIFVGIQLFGYANYFIGTGNNDLTGFYKSATIFTIILSIMACQDVFNKLRNTPSGIQYLMTPATITEKYSAAWLYSSLFAIATAQLTYFVVHFLSVNIGNLLTGTTSEFCFPEWIDVRNVFLGSMFTHAVFFFGSILFRKNPIIKTLGSYIGVVFLLTILFAWFAKHYLINSSFIGSDNMSINMDGSLGSSINGVPVSEILEFIGVNIKWVLGGIAFLLWGGAYLLLTKKQI